MKKWLSAVATFILANAWLAAAATFVISSALIAGFYGLLDVRASRIPIPLYPPVIGAVLAWVVFRRHRAKFRSNPNSIHKD
jgi:hypothetical protein